MEDLEVQHNLGPALQETCWAIEMQYSELRKSMMIPSDSRSGAPDAIFSTFCDSTVPFANLTLNKYCILMGYIERLLRSACKM